MLARPREGRSIINVASGRLDDVEAIAGVLARGTDTARR
jgi:hypothetical protein